MPTITVHVFDNLGKLHAIVQGEASEVVEILEEVYAMDLPKFTGKEYFFSYPEIKEIYC